MDKNIGLMQDWKNESEVSYGDVEEILRFTYKHREGKVVIDGIELTLDQAKQVYEGYKMVVECGVIKEV